MWVRRWGVFASAESAVGASDVQRLSTTKTTSSNCRIPERTCFINSSHLSTGLPTEDYGGAAGMPSLLPGAPRGFGCCQTRGTKASAQIRHLHTKHRGVGGWVGGGSPRRRELRRVCLVQEALKSEPVGPAHRRLAGRDLSDLRSMRVWVNIVTGFIEPPPASIRDKYRLDLTAPITLPICQALGCWQRCPASHMSSWGGGGTGLQDGCLPRVVCQKHTANRSHKTFLSRCRRRAEPPMAFVPSKASFASHRTSDRTGSPDASRIPTSDTCSGAHVRERHARRESGTSQSGRGAIKHLWRLRSKVAGADSLVETETRSDCAPAMLCCVSLREQTSRSSPPPPQAPGRRQNVPLPPHRGSEQLASKQSWPSPAGSSGTPSPC